MTYRHDGDVPMGGTGDGTIPVVGSGHQGTNRRVPGPQQPPLGQASGGSQASSQGAYTPTTSTTIEVVDQLDLSVFDREVTKQPPWQLPKLDDTNWREWQDSMYDFLGGRRLWGFIDGTQYQPVKGTPQWYNYSAYERFVSGMLKNHATSAQKGHIKLGVYSSPKEIYNTWAGIHTSYASSRLVPLVQRLISIKAKNNETVSMVASQARRLNDQIGEIDKTAKFGDVVLALVIMRAFQDRKRHATLMYHLYNEDKLTSELVVQRLKTAEDGDLKLEEHARIGQEQKYSIRRNVECYRCHQKGHIARNCEAKSDDEEKEEVPAKPKRSVKKSDKTAENRPNRDSSKKGSSRGNKKGRKHTTAVAESDGDDGFGDVEDAGVAEVLEGPKYKDQVSSSSEINNASSRGASIFGDVEDAGVAEVLEDVYVPSNGDINNLSSDGASTEKEGVTTSVEPRSCAQSTQFDEVDELDEKRAGGPRSVEVALLAVDDEEYGLASGLRSKSRTSTTTWTIDSGASRHMTMDRASFVKYEGHTGEVRVGGGRLLPIRGRGEGRVDITQGRVKIAVGRQSNNLYQLSSVIVDTALVSEGDLPPSDEISGESEFPRAGEGDNEFDSHPPPVKRSVNDDAFRTFHLRLGHPGNARLLRAYRHLYGFPKLKIPEKFLCDVCENNKFTRRIRKYRYEKQTEPGGRLFADVWGKYTVRTPIPGLGVIQYFLSVVDEASGHAELFTMASRSEVVRLLMTTINRYDRMEGRRIVIRYLRTDNAKEFVAVREELEKRGIQVEPASDYTPEQNGVAERFNRTIITTVRCMLQSAGLPDGFCHFAAEYANYLRNKLPLVPREVLLTSCDAPSPG